MVVCSAISMAQVSLRRWLWKPPAKKMPDAPDIVPIMIIEYVVNIPLKYFIRQRDMVIYIKEKNALKTYPERKE